MQIFYTPGIATDPELPAEEARHAIRVLRLGTGSEIRLTDGKGSFYKAVIDEATAKRCTFSVTERLPQPPLWSFRLHIAVAPTKNMDRMEWFCEKATEVGIDAITFLDCHNSERRDVKTLRLEKILVSAIKQSHKATLPKLAGMAAFHDFIRQPFNGRKFIAHCEEGDKQLLAQTCKPGENALILIGPEGDFTPEEIKAAISCGFEAISLGNSRLRTETAALVACTIVQAINP